jgi:hypothetical protein
MEGFLEPFDLPNSRTVHGYTFPLGLRPVAGLKLTSEDVTKGIQKLAADGVIRDLLSRRTFCIHPRMKIH